jgi:uncharacterized protein YktB (UPF0637 family)
MKKEKDYTEFEVVKDNQLSESELNELREAVNRVNEAQMQIGGLEAHKAKLLAEILLFTKEVESTQKILASKYGDVSIDLNTGKFTENAVDKKD